MKPVDDESKEQPLPKQTEDLKTSAHHSVPPAGWPEEKVESLPKEDISGEEQMPGFPFKTTNIHSNTESNLDDLAKKSLAHSSGFHRLHSQDSSDAPWQISSLGSQLHPHGLAGGHHKKPGKSTKILQLGILFIVGVAVIGATIYLLKGGQLIKPTPTPTPVAAVTSPTPTPSPAPSVLVDRSKYEIRVLNGTGKSGLAASISAKLKELGYKADKVGNATNSSFAQTTVRVAGIPELAEQLVKDLSPDYDATASGILKASDSVDGEVILGFR